MSTEQCSDAHCWRRHTATIPGEVQSVQASGGTATYIVYKTIHQMKELRGTVAEIEANDTYVAWVQRTRKSLMEPEYGPQMADDNLR